MCVCVCMRAAEGGGRSGGRAGADAREQTRGRADAAQEGTCRYNRAGATEPMQSKQQRANECFLCLESFILGCASACVCACACVCVRAHVGE